MKNGIPELKPKAKDLLVYEKHGCFIVYDHSTQKAHDLNQLAAAVWRRCDGTKSVEDIVLLLNQDLAQPVDDELVWFAVTELNRSGVLQGEMPSMMEPTVLSRRELIKKMGIGTVMAIPVVTSIVVPTPAAAQSGMARRKHNGSSQRR